MYRPTFRRAWLTTALWLAFATAASAQLPTLVISTKSTGTIGGVSAQATDLLVCSLQATGQGTTQCNWKLFLKGSAAGLSRQVEAVDVLPDGRLVIRVESDNPSPSILRTDLALFTPSDPLSLPY